MSGKKMKICLTMILIFSMLTCNVSMAGTDVNEQNITVQTDVVESGVYKAEYPEEDDWFAGYIEKQMFADDGISAYSWSMGETVFTGLQLEIYRELKKGIARIAENGGSTTIEFETTVFEPVSAVGTKEEVEASMTEQIVAQFNNMEILEGLLADCPYELYWFDKTTGFSSGFGYAYGGTTNSDGTQYDVSVDVVTFLYSFEVSEDYQAEEYMQDSPAVTSDVSKVSTAVANAKQLVQDNLDKTDREKLIAYRDYICSAVSYNFDAVAEDYAGGYGNPWEIIYVFDEDESTNVVCEGYAKALHYLCELSAFYDDNFESYLMTGITGSSETNYGSHMWNVICLGDVNYLIDLTNYDGYSSTVRDLYFMAYNLTESDETGYTVVITPNSTTFYIYDDLTKGFYAAEARTVGTEPTYGIYVKDSGNGSVNLVHKYVKENAQILLADIDVKANRGFKFQGWQSVTEDLSVEDNQIIMPAKDIVLKAIFVERLLGDLDEDGEVTVEDLDCLRRYLIGAYELEDDYPADVRGTQEYDSRNIIRMKKMLNGITE